MRRIEPTQLVVAATAGQHRDVVDIGVGHHRRERLVGVLGVELVADMLFPQADEIDLSLPCHGPLPDNGRAILARWARACVADAHRPRARLRRLTIKRCLYERFWRDAVW